jgi:transketolase C-terminal domain/subunit
LRLGYGIKPTDISIPAFAKIRKLLSGNKVTIIGSGPVLLNAFEALKKFKENPADVFVVSQQPLTVLTNELKESISKTKKLIIIEEHVKRGGLGENIASALFEEGIFCKYSHLCIKGYISGLYGNQAYHLEENGLNVAAITSEIKKFIDGQY